MILQEIFSLIIITRNDLSEGLHRRLCVSGNKVLNLYEFEDEIEKIFERKSYSYSQSVKTAEERVLTDLRKVYLIMLETDIQIYKQMALD